MIATTPVRNPDTGSPRLMTKRAWWLVGLNIVIPGSAQVVAGNRRLGRFGLGATLLLWALVVVVLIGLLLAREPVLTVFASTPVLWFVVALCVFYAGLWVLLTLDTLRLARLIKVAPAARGLIGGLAVVAMVLVAGSAGFAAVTTTSAIGLLDSVFSGGQVADPINGRYNILLLGGDAGADRIGLRPDSISVASVDAATGAVTLLGIPRNLQRAPFVAGSPLWGAWPHGFDCGVDCLIDYVYSYGHDHAALYPDAQKKGSTPGIEAMRDTVEGVLGITLQYYVLVDMQGFAQLVDALGGVDITVADRLPIGSNNFDNGAPAPPIGYIEAGAQHMDGQTALWYARSRYGTTDYSRMERQRQLQQAIIAQANPTNVLANFSAIAKAGQQVVSTDIPQAMLAHFVDLGSKARSQPVTSIDFAPPAFDMVHPDFAAIRAKVAGALRPPSSPSP